MVNSRAKGAAFERDIVNLLKNFCNTHKANIHISRNFEQLYKKNQCDINFLNYAIECKRYAKGKTYKKGWWDQVCIAAGKTRIPVLVFKYDRADINVALPFYAFMENEPTDNNKVYTCPWEEFTDIIKQNKIFQAYVIN